MNQALVWSAK